jgi:hypothetical protein
MPIISITAVCPHFLPLPHLFCIWYAHIVAVFYSLNLKYILLEYVVDSDCNSSDYLTSPLHISVCRWLFYISMLYVYWKLPKVVVWEVFIPYFWMNILVLFYACSVCNFGLCVLCIGLFIALLYVSRLCIGKLTLFVHIVCTIVWRW